MVNKHNVKLPTINEAEQRLSRFISKLNQTINSERVSPRYIYVLEFLYPKRYTGPNDKVPDDKVFRREVYDNLKALINDGLDNYEIPYQIADTDEQVNYFDRINNDGELSQDYCDYYRKQGARLSDKLVDMASYMVCDMICKGIDYYFDTIRIRRTTVKQLEKLKIKEAKNQ